MRLARLARRPQALGAEFHLNRNAAVEREGRFLDVGLPHAAGMPFGEADVVAKRGLLAADLTLCHCRITSSALAEYNTIHL